MSGEKKTYRWRIANIIFVSMFILYLFFLPCSTSINRCFWGDDMQIVMLSFHISLAILLIAVFAFFISNKIFKKWLIFTIMWFFIDIIWVISSPEYSRSFIDIIPSTKESVSIWMSSLFVIISIIMFIWMTIKEKRK